MGICNVMVFMNKPVFSSWGISDDSGDVITDEFTFDKLPNTKDDEDLGEGGGGGHSTKLVVDVWFVQAMSRGEPLNTIRAR